MTALHPRVVVVGAGFGGLALARALRHDQVAVELVDRRNHHLFQPLLYQVATAGLEPSDVAYAVRGVTRRIRNARFTTAEVTGVDLDAKVLRTAGGRDVPYDYLVLAAGARTASFGTPGVEEHAFGLKSLDDATSFREHLLRQFERCAADPARIAEGALSVVVVGGGPTGVEMAGALAELYGRVLARDFPELDVGQARVELLELQDALLPPFRRPLQDHALEELRRRGVSVRTGVRVAEVRDGEVELGDGTVLRAHTVLWAAGVEAVPLAAQLGLALQRSGRVPVEPDLSLPDHREVFVIGDMAASRDASGELHPMLAPVAVQQARCVAATIRRRVVGRPGRPFRYVDKGTMATIGRRAAVAEFPGGIRLTGTLGWLSWVFLHVVLLIGFRNRLSVLLNWAWNYLTWDRAARVLIDPVAPGARGAGGATGPVLLRSEDGGGRRAG